MTDRRHLGRDEDTDRRRSAVARREEHESPETAAVLDLQERAGNRAVAGMLETQGATARGVTLQLQPDGPAQPANDDKSSAAATMTIPEMKLSIPILSYSRDVGGPNQPKKAGGNLTVSIPVKSLDPRLAQAVARGDRFETITIEARTHKITLHGVMFSSFQMGGDVATLTLNFTSIEFGPGTEPPDPDKGEDYAL